MKQPFPLLPLPSPHIRRLRGGLLLLAAGVLTGCTWIKLTDAGAGVMQGTPDSVQDCQLVGNVTASTQDRVVMRRSMGKVSEELIVMARNEAPIVGGDTVVPSGPAVDGRQDFQVYRCR